MDTKIIKQYKELRKKYPEEEYKFLFEGIPGLENLDSDIIEDDKKAEEKQILDLQGEYWNFASFAFNKLKKMMIKATVQRLIAPNERAVKSIIGPKAKTAE